MPMSGIICKTVSVDPVRSGLVPQRKDKFPSVPPRSITLACNLAEVDPTCVGSAVCTRGGFAKT